MQDEGKDCCHDLEGGFRAIAVFGLKDNLWRNGRGSITPYRIMARSIRSLMVVDGPTKKVDPTKPEKF